MGNCQLLCASFFSVSQHIVNNFFLKSNLNLPSSVLKTITPCPVTTGPSKIFWVFSSDSHMFFIAFSLQLSKKMFSSWKLLLSSFCLSSSIWRRQYHCMRQSYAPQAAWCKEKVEIYDNLCFFSENKDNFSTDFVHEGIKLSCEKDFRIGFPAPINFWWLSLSLLSLQSIFLRKKKQMKQFPPWHDGDGLNSWTEHAAVALVMMRVV